MILGALLQNHTNLLLILLLPFPCAGRYYAYSALCQTVPFQSCGGAAAPPGREPALARALSQTGCVCAIETNPTINFNLKILLNLKAAGLQIYKIVRKN